MRLLQINLTQNVGSTGKIAEQIGQIIINQGGESYIAWGRLCANTTSKSIRINNRFESIFHIAIQHILDMDGYGSICGTKRLINTIDKINPDIIHLHVIHDTCLNFEILFKYLATVSTPIVWTFHDCWAFTGHCTHFEFLKCNKWQTQCNKCLCQKNYSRLELFNRAKFNFKLKKRYFTSLKNLTIVPVSYWLEALVKQSFLSEYDIKVIHNGIDIDTFRPICSNVKERYGIPSDRFVVIGVANYWGVRKGYHDFLKLASLNPQWTFIMIGLSDEQIKSVPSNIVGISFTNSQQELAELYSVADVFVNATYEDTYPTVNLEALACGTPVVTYNTGGSPESLTKEIGYVVPQGDIKALERKIFEIESTGKMAYSRQCRLFAENSLNMTDRFEEYIQLYKKLIDKNQI